MPCPYESGTEKIHGGLCHHDLHDGFAPAGARDTTGLNVSIAAAADQRRIAYAPRHLAACTAGRSARDQASVAVERHCSDGAVIMSQMELPGVCAFATLPPGRSLALQHQFLRGAQLETVFRGEAFRSAADQHHVLARLHHLARKANGVTHTFDCGYGAGLHRNAIHDDGLELDAPVAVQVRADAGEKDRKSTRLNSSHVAISYAVFCLKKKTE